MRASAGAWKPRRGVKARNLLVGRRETAPSADHDPSGERFEWEHACWDPKDGELCLNRAKPGETLVEARSGSDVQIDRRIWV